MLHDEREKAQRVRDLFEHASAFHLLDNAHLFFRILLKVRLRDLQLSVLGQSLD